MRIQDASAGRVEFQPMIRTLNAIAADDLAHMQRCESVRTAVLQCGDMSVRFSEKDDRLFQNRAAEQLTFGEVIGPGGDVPRVAQIGPADHFLFAVEKLELHGARHRGSSMTEADLAGARSSQWRGGVPARMQRIIFRAIVAGQAAVSDVAHGANPPDALCADGGSRDRSVRVGGNQTARRAIILWRSRKAPLPPKSQRER